MALSTAAVLHAKGRQQPYKLTDSPGLVLLVDPDGWKYWRYHYRFDGKQKTMALGVYPGIDPMKQRKDAERERRVCEQETFKAIAEEWLEHLKLRARAAATAVAGGVLLSAPWRPHYNGQYGDAPGHLALSAPK